MSTDQESYAIAYKPDRILCWPQFFASEEAAKKMLATFPAELREAVHIVKREENKKTVEVEAQRD